MKHTDTIELEEKAKRYLLAERHKKARYDAISEVSETMNRFTQMNEEGRLYFNAIEKEVNVLKRKIMNLPL